MKPGFLQPKVRIDLSRGPANGVDFDDPMAALPWVAEFNLAVPRDLDTVRMIIRLSKTKGQKFLAHPMSFVDTPDEATAAAVFDHFPTLAEVYEAAGGGVYNLRARTKLGSILKTLSVPGPKRESKKQAEKRQKASDAQQEEFKAKALETAFQWIQKDPDLMVEVGLLFLPKSWASGCRSGHLWKNG